MNNTIKHPTQLWISDPITLDQQMTAYLQKNLCANNACQSCITCKQIVAKEHPYIQWLQPERSYNLEQIDELIQSASFQLDPHEQRFFIIQQAHRLTEQCSNRLLKTIEEPFAGYNFFFLTQAPHALPLTIQSRCVVQKFTSQAAADTYKEFLIPFTALQFNDPINFIKQLEALDIKEQETKELVDELFETWSAQAKRDVIQDNTSLQTSRAMMHLLKDALDNPPMTGGAKIFWRNLYMIAHHATKNSVTLS